MLASFRAASSPRYATTLASARFAQRLPSPRPQYSTSRQQTPIGARDRAAVGVFTPTAAALFVAAGVGLYFYFRHEKAKLLERRQAEREAKQLGRAHVGGPFALTSHHNKPFSEQDLLGKWSLLYFGFTNCPDICPAELDKMSAIVDSLEKKHALDVQPIFISVDPARDSIPKIERYLADFHPRFIGLTGDYASIKSACKAFRVYFSTPPEADPRGDYLVDHSVFIYLMDPNGEFVEAFGQATTVDDVVSRVHKEVTSVEQGSG